MCRENNRCYVLYKFGKQILIVQAFEGAFLKYLFFVWGNYSATGIPPIVNRLVIDGR